MNKVQTLTSISLLLLALLFSNFQFSSDPLGSAEKIPNWHFIDKAIVPTPSKEMPHHVRMLYADEVNMIELEAAFAAYYDKRGWNEVHEDLERDPYAKFFHFWYEAAQEYVEDDGMVRALSTEELAELREEQLKLTKKIEDDVQKAGPSSSWSFLGPKRTYWRADHNPGLVAPWQVNIYTVAVAPSNPSILYAGSETGVLYKSTDKGLNWYPFNDYNWGAAILSVEIHPTDPNIVYAANSTDIFKTTDGGTSWSIIKTESGLSCNSLAISPTTPSTLFAGSSNGLYKSTDSGANWTTMLTEQVDDVQFRPNDGTTVYAITRTTASPNTYNFYKSTDSGASFSVSMNGWGTYYESSGSRITVTPANADYIYAVLLTDDGTGNNKVPVVLKTTDAAANWTTVATGNSGPLGMSNGQGYYDLDIVASHANAEHLIVATTTAYKSTDGGVNYTTIGGYSGSFAIHPDIQCMVSIMDGATENTWLTTDGGANFSSDFYTSIANWEARIDGLDGTNFWGYAQGWNEDFMVGGRYHNGNTAMHENYPDKQALRMGGAESPTGWAMHGRERHAAFDDIAEYEIPDDITVAPTGGAFLFTKHPNIYYYGNAFSRVMIDLEDYMTVYTGNGNDFWKSEDGGGSWESLHTFGGKPYHFDISRKNPDYIYLTADDGFYRSTDRGESFTEMTLPSGLSDWHAQNLRVAASARNQDHVWVLNHRSGSGSTAGRVWKSVDGGASWTSWNTTALDGRKWTAIANQAGTNGGIYIASNRGSSGTFPSKVMYRDNSMNDWVDFSSNLPESANPIKLLPFYRDGKLRWAGNRGVWEVDFYDETWAPIAQPFVNGKNQYCSRDTVEFDSYSVAKGTATYSWSIPGASWTSSLTEREVQAIFPSNGTYTATLTIDQDGTVVSESVSVTIDTECEAEQKPGNAVNMSGASSDYVATNNTMDLTTNTMTMSAWIKRNGDQNSYAGIIFHRAGTANGLNFRNNNELGFHWNNSQWGWSSGLIVPDNEWAHVAMVVSPTETTLYLNGQPSVNTANPPSVLFDGVMNFGADPNWSARRFNGEMDEVIIYNRSLSQDEIRELMHLTRVPANETDLIGYWQFNRTSGAVTDRAGINHASLLGGAGRVTSTVPVGPGESMRMDVNAGGTYAFGTTDLTLEFPAGGSTFPNGELCVTRIDHAPDQSPSLDVNDSYWVVRNYGTNATFDELSSLYFDNVEVNSAQAAAPSSIKLYKRASNADGTSWGTYVDFAELATEGTTDGNVTFSTDNGQTSFSQFILSYESPELPAELISFNVLLNRSKEVEIKWATASEENVSHYDVERSRDGYDFHKIAQVEAIGNSASILNYENLDKNPFRGVSYYRLKIVDVDGSYEYSVVRSITNHALAEKVVLYPNPLRAGELLTVKTDIAEKIEMRIYSADGEEVAEFSFTGDIELELPRLANGSYGYTLRTSSWKSSGILVMMQ